MKEINLKQRIKDTPIENHTLREIIASFLKDGSFNITKLSSFSENKSKNIDNAPYLLSNEVVIFKTIAKKLGKDNTNIAKISKISNFNILSFLKGHIPVEYRSLSSEIIIIRDMSIINSTSGDAKDYFDDNEPYNKRIYINMPINKKSLELITIFKLKCIELGVSSHIFGSFPTVIYSNNSILDKHMMILDEILSSRSDIASIIGDPIIYAGRVKNNNNKCYYAISSDTLCNMDIISFYERLYYSSFLLLCSKYYDKSVLGINEILAMPINNIHNTICKYNDTLLKDLRNKRKSLDELTNDYKYIVRIIASFMKYNDYDHLNVPIYADEPMVLYLNDSACNKKSDIDKEKDIYLYNIDDSINKVLTNFSKNSGKTNELIIDYLATMNNLYKKYMYYASREENYIFKEKHRLTLIKFDNLLTKFKVPEKPDNSLLYRYYDEVYNGVMKYINKFIK